TKKVIAIGASDNLIKGAAGQAIQTMNLMFGLEEKTGIELVTDFPV
ncbi:MAG: N-acetyl-gamma-glutamyl-phosphate reductase, partial [Eubacteriaceae bacterium]|nr:N-acetyl-gamma-glutamyl-phosphate reductase [Eubacteriaceae bacterium]